MVLVAAGRELGVIFEYDCRLVELYNALQESVV